MKCLLFALFVMFPFCLHAQSRHQNLLESGKFDKAAKKISKSLEKSPDDVTANFAMGELLSNRLYESNDARQAYGYVVRAKALFEEIHDTKELQRLDRDSINSESISKLLDSACNLAYEHVLASNIDSLNGFLSYYSIMPSRIKQRVVAQRNALAYGVAQKENTIQAFQYFIDNYPDAADNGDAISKRNQLAFDAASRENTIEAYKEFVDHYRYAKEVDKAKGKIYQLAFDEAKRIDNAAAYSSYIREYPQSPLAANAKSLLEQREFSEVVASGSIAGYRDFIKNNRNNVFAPAAIDSLAKLAIEAKNVSVLWFAVEAAEGRQKEQLKVRYKDMYCSDGETPTFERFYDEHTDLFSESQMLTDKLTAQIGDLLHLEMPFKQTLAESYDKYIKAAAPNERAFLALQRLIAPAVNKKDWGAAIKQIKGYVEYFPLNDLRLTGLLDILGQKTDKEIRISDAGAAINSSDGAEYAPVISADDKQLFFCGRDRKNNIGGEDIFVSKKSGTNWGAATLVRDLSSAITNDAPMNISADGNTLLLFKSGKIYHSEKTKTGWEYAEPFPDVINAAEWQGDAMLSANSKALFFISEKRGGYNQYNKAEYGSEPYHGRIGNHTDIYVSLLDENGEWGEPINLGSVINTQFCERMPFLHPDMKTLYFSSDGHGGLGGLDVFMSTRLSDSCWDCWSAPVNLGKEINTTDDDWGYKISTDGERAYFSRCTGIHEHIYWLNLPVHLRPSYVATITGKLVDKNNKPVVAEIHWEDLVSGKEIGISKSDPEDGNYFMALPMGKLYGYYINNKDYYPTANSIDLTKNKGKFIL